MANQPRQFSIEKQTYRGATPEGLAPVPMPTGEAGQAAVASVVAARAASNSTLALAKSAWKAGSAFRPAECWPSAPAALRACAAPGVTGAAPDR